MRELAMQYYRQGYNCSQCLLKAAEATYNKPISRQSMAMCRGVTTGFGIGGMCSVLIAGIMVFGMFFEGDTVKRLRMRLLDEFQSKHHDMNCARLIKERRGGDKCEALVGEIADMVEKLIDEETRK